MFLFGSDGVYATVIYKLTWQVCDVNDYNRGFHHEKEITPSLKYIPILFVV